MSHSIARRAIALTLACVASGLGTSIVAADSPSVETWTNHVEVTFGDCPDFAVGGIWDISHKLTIFTDGAGTPIRDIERVDFSGRLVNLSSGTWVADSGTKLFFDTLAPDGSFLTTFMSDVRKSAYVHGAGRSDFQTGAFHGTDAFSDANFAALCVGLGG